MTTVHRITDDEWPALRAARLAALTDAPQAFGSTLDRELAFTDDVWRERAAASASGSERLTLLAWEGDEIVGIVGGFRVGDRADVVELVSMWTHPSIRRSGVGVGLVQGVLDWARSIEARQVELWVVHGNQPALLLYERLGFVVTGDHQPHPDDPCASEVRMVHHLVRGEPDR